MSTSIFSLDGGDLGLAKYQTPIWQIPVIVSTVADIFSNLLEIKPLDREFSFCIKVDPDYTNTVRAMIMDIIRNGLPDNISIYEINGEFLFDIRGVSGGIVHSKCFYVITKRKI